MSKSKTNARYKLVFIAVDRETGKHQNIHPHDLPFEKRQEISDRVAEAMGFERIKEENAPKSVSEVKVG